MNKYLEKAAGLMSTLKSPVAKHALGWGAAGAALGGFGARGTNLENQEKFKQGKISAETLRKRHASVLGRAAFGGVIGGAYGGAMKNVTMKAEEFRRKSQEWNEAYHGGSSRSSGSHRSYNSGSGYGSGHWGSSASDLDSIYSDLGAPKGGFKTKAEATRHYRKMAAKHHPDRGGKVEDMQRVNAAWDKFKKHGAGFDKLASWNCEDLLMKAAEFKQ